MSKKINVKITKKPKSIVEIEGEAAAEHFDSYWDKAIKHLGKDAEIPGFRKGHVPENILVKQLSEMHILEEMAEMLFNDVYPEILEEHKIDAIGRPEIKITKIAKGNPLGFVISTTIVPEVPLPDYKKIAPKAKKDEEVVVTDEDVEKAIKEIRQMRAHQALHDANIEHEHQAEIKDEDLPELNDEFVKTLGAFQNVAEFNTKLKENLLEEKKRELQDKNRIAIIEEILKAVEVEVPEILTNSELQKLKARLTEDVTRLGFTLEDYLKQIKKTEEELLAEWRPDAEKRAKLELVIDAIAKKENITPAPEDMERELQHLMSQYKDADPLRAQMYVESILRNELVFKFLENLA